MPGRSRSPGICGEKASRPLRRRRSAGSCLARGWSSPQPRKRPRSSYTRFEAAQPNETWQSDVTHWRLADVTDVEILNWLDDHSRYLLSSTVHRPVSGDDVVSMFLATVDEHGTPGLDADRQRARLHRPVRRRPQRALSTCCRCSASARRTGPQGTRKPRARSNDSTRPSNAGWPSNPQPGRRPSSNSNSTASASTTTNTALTAPWDATPPVRPTGPHPKPAPQPAKPQAITACATTASTPKAR